MPDYIYHGDKLSDHKFKRQVCTAVRRPSGKCIRGKNSNMLVVFETGETVVILARTLRKIKP
jgi:hypothetical protein